MSSTDVNVLDLVLLVVRVAAGITLFLHGYQKFFLGGKIKGTAGWFESLGMKPGIVHAYTAACTEISCGLGFAVGFLTPLTAAGFVGILTVATWTHKGKFFIFKDGWEYNVMLAALAILIAVVGPGRWSADHLFGLDEDLHGLLGLVLSLVGLVAAVGLLLVAWRPPVKDEATT